MSDRTGHSPLGASANHCWLPCPGSIALTERLELGDGESSEAAREGTAAHRFAAILLEDGRDAWELAGETTVVEGQIFTMDDEMVAGVQLYLDTVRNDRGRHLGGFWVEHPVGLDHIHEELWGTLDAGVAHGPHLRIYDLKYGKGLWVGVEWNTQLMQYGAALLSEITKLFPDIEVVEFVIVQPRIECIDGPVRRWQMTVDELSEWVDETLEPGTKRVDAARQLDFPIDPASGLLKEGGHCTFCPAQTECPLKKAKFLETMSAIELEADVDPTIISHDNIGEMLQRLQALDDFRKALEKEVFARLRAGKPVTGFKLVLGDGKRVLQGEWQPAAEKLWGDAAFERKSLAMTKLEKLIGGKTFVKKWAKRQPGPQTMVPVDDARPAVAPVDMNDQFSSQIQKENENG